MRREARPLSEIAFTDTIPVLRILDVARAAAFYGGFLGFATDWDHRLGDGLPLYRQMSRAGLRLHLSEHHGDATPGATVFAAMRRLAAYHAELTAKAYPALRPGIEDLPWGRMMEVIDPCGNRIRSCEGSAGPEAPTAGPRVVALP